MGSVPHLGCGRRGKDKGRHTLNYMKSGRGKELKKYKTVNCTNVNIYNSKALHACMNSSHKYAYNESWQLQ